MRSLDAAWAEVKPWLDSLEQRRKAGVRRVVLFAILAIPAGLIVLAVLAAVGLPVEPAGMIGFVAAAGLAYWGYRPLGVLRKAVKAGLNDRLASAFGLSYAAIPPNPSACAELQRFDLLPRADRSAFEDHFSGEAHGARFELFEAKLEQEQRDDKGRVTHVNVFTGVLVRIAFPRTVTGVTLLTRDKGLFNALEGWAAKTVGRAGRKLQRIGLVDPTFEKLFEVYGTDQVMARYLLTPSFMERLLRLETLLKGKKVRCVFDESLGEGGIFSL